MSLYAAQPARALRQVLGDLVFLLVVVGALWLSMTVHDAVDGLAGPGEDVEAAGSGLAGGLADAGDFLSGVPLVGDDVATPFEDATAAADRMSAAGADAAVAVERLAFWLGVVVASFPIVLVGFAYLPGRVRFVRESVAVRRLGRDLAPGGPEVDLLALRALARQPLSAVRGVGGDVAARWRAGDPDTVRRLADLELAANGVRTRRRTPPPGHPPGPPPTAPPGRPLEPGPGPGPQAGPPPGARGPSTSVAGPRPRPSHPGTPGDSR